MNERLERCIDRYVAGTISKDEMGELNSVLERNREARDELADHLNLDSALAEMAAGWRSDSEECVAAFPEVDTKKRLAVRVWGLGVAAAVAGIMVVVFFARRESGDDSFARVKQTVGVVEFGSGDRIGPETFRIEAGTVELLTAKGARVVIEAPAEFRMSSDQKLHLISGRLAADVPPAAKGFTVVTPDGEAIDLGTKFGVDVPESGNAEIHVFEGEVIAKASETEKKQSLKGGEAFTLKEKLGQQRELRSAAFIHPDEVRELSAGMAAGQKERAGEADEMLRSDPALVAFIDFENTRHPGVYRLVQGRWPGSTAPEFVNEGDHMALDVGGEREYPHLTLAAWVRLDRLGAPYQSLLHTDGWSSDNPGQVHWMINRDATMRLALNSNTLAPGSDEQHGYPDSRTPVLPEKGRWVHLAVTYDAEAKKVRFYLNGRFDKETRLAVTYPARLGPAQIGNWDRIDRKLSGRIDQLAILGRVMKDEEVKSLFESGNPYR